jgi:hypothetical protein
VVGRGNHHNNLAGCRHTHTQSLCYPANIRAHHILATCGANRGFYDIGLLDGSRLGKIGVLRRLQIRPLYRITRWALLVVIVFLPLSVIATNLAVVPDYRAYAQGWDARHAQILEAKAQGESNITVGTLAYYPEDNWGIERIATLERGTYNSCGVGFYGVDSITVLPNDES